MISWMTFCSPYMRKYEWEAFTIASAARIVFKITASLEILHSKYIVTIEIKIMSIHDTRRVTSFQFEESNNIGP